MQYKNIILQLRQRRYDIIACLVLLTTETALLLYYGNLWNAIGDMTGLYFLWGVLVLILTLLGKANGKKIFSKTVATLAHIPVIFFICAVVISFLIRLTVR